MSNNTLSGNTPVTQAHVAPQQRGPRPLGAFLSIVAEQTDGDRDRVARVLAGVRAYQAHPYRRMLRPPAKIARVGETRLVDYGGSGAPAVFVPSLINPPSVLDLAASNSMLRWLAQHGIRPLLVDWGMPGAEERHLSIDGYVVERLLPLIEALDEPSALVGYCLGGTMALAAAALRSPPRLALLAAPWEFAGYGDAQRASLTAYWREVQPPAAAFGALPMEMIQPMFWRLDPAAAVAKFERFAQLDPASPAAEAFVALEDWANDGPPLSLPVARQLFEEFYGRDVPGSGWRIGGTRVDPAALAMPVLNLVSTRDRIVPAAAAPVIGERRDVDAGHVGMIVGSRAKALVWEPLRDFLLA